MTRYVWVSVSHKTPCQVLSQQSVVGSHEERVVGLPRSFLNWRRACLSCGLHSSESALPKNTTMSKTMVKVEDMFVWNVICLGIKNG